MIYEDKIIDTFVSQDEGETPESAPEGNDSETESEGEEKVSPEETPSEESM